jgi:hypothetical protein
VLHVLLDSGASRVLAYPPGSSHTTFAVTADRIYVPNPDGHEVFILERRSGRVLGSATVGRHPISITLASR